MLGIFALFQDLMIFSAFVDNKSSFPKPLSKEKESEYLKRAAAGDEEAKELLIKHNLRLVAHIAKKYMNYPDTDELISVGSIGLIKAINTYRDGKGTQLATYAARCIENEILMLLRVNKKHKCNVSIDEPVGTDKEGNEIALIDVLSCSADSVFEGVEKGILVQKLLSLVKTSLDEREYRVIVLRYGIGGGTPLTQREVADVFGISRSYISRIEKRAVEKLRAIVKKEELYF